jgi:RNA polymerase sigma-70 factor, ECF subfamily
VSGQAETMGDPVREFLALYDQALPHVYGYFLARCGSRAAAEDLTAETFLAAVVVVRDRGTVHATEALLVRARVMFRRAYEGREGSDG